MVPADPGIGRIKVEQAALGGIELSFGGGFTPGQDLFGGAGVFRVSGQFCQGRDVGKLGVRIACGTFFQQCGKRGCGGFAGLYGGRVFCHGVLLPDFGRHRCHAVAEMGPVLSRPAPACIKSPCQYKAVL